MNADRLVPVDEPTDDDAKRSVWSIRFNNGVSWSTRTQPMEAAIAEAKQRLSMPEDSHGLARRMASCDDVGHHIGDPTCDDCAYEMWRFNRELELNPPREEPDYV